MHSLLPLLYIINLSPSSPSSSSPPNSPRHQRRPTPRVGNHISEPTPTPSTFEVAPVWNTTGAPRSSSLESTPGAYTLKAAPVHIGPRGIGIPTGVTEHQRIDTVFEELEHPGKLYGQVSGGPKALFGKTYVYAAFSSFSCHALSLPLPPAQQAQS